MKDQRKGEGGLGSNEGEGSRTAARKYNQAGQSFAQSGKVEDKAREAKEALEGEQGDELRQAETVGKSHVAEEDPKLKKK